MSVIIYPRGIMPPSLYPKEVRFFLWLSRHYDGKRWECSLFSDEGDVTAKLYSFAALTFCDAIKRTADETLWAPVRG